MNELVSNIEHKNPNTKREENEEEWRKQTKNRTRSLILYTILFFSVNKRKTRMKKKKRKKPQMKLFERTYTETRMAHTPLEKKNEAAEDQSHTPVSSKK